ncbi:MAG: hypothetical protein EBT22_13875 [Chloroflexi bacterium]|nr:hypothetical protein [Chloroflexota bacterium]
MSPGLNRSVTSIDLALARWQALPDAWGRCYSCRMVALANRFGRYRMLSSPVECREGTRIGMGATLMATPSSRNG